jgi:hypothetical protein
MSPLVIGEAISAGLALIGSDSPGVQEACQKGHFVTFKRGNTEELSAIFTALNDNALDFNEPKQEFDGWTAEMMAKWHCEQYSRLMRKSN